MKRSRKHPMDKCSSIKIHYSHDLNETVHLFCNFFRMRASTMLRNFMWEMVFVSILAIMIWIVEFIDEDDLSSCFISPYIKSYVHISHFNRVFAVYASVSFFRHILCPCYKRTIVKHVSWYFSVQLHCSLCIPQYQAVIFLWPKVSTNQIRNLKKPQFVVNT